MFDADKVGIDPSFAGALRLQQQITGGTSLSSASRIESLVPVIPCPLAWGWASGGVNGMPLIGALGCDSMSGAGKSTLAWEHIRWTLEAGGIGIYIGNEERPNPQFMRSILYSLPYEARMNLILSEVSSIDAWTSEVLSWKKKSQKFLDKDPEERVPILTVVDSLTGRGTQGEQDKAEKQGVAARGFSEAAMAISKFFKAFTYAGQLFSLFHIQHAKKSQDQYARGDDQFVANGGDEPRFNANYHFRILRSADFKFADYEGRDMTVKFVKSFLGPAKRMISVRVIWVFRKKNLPVFEMYGDGEDVVFDVDYVDGETMPADEAVDWWTDINPHVPIALAYKLAVDMHVFDWKAYAAKLKAVTDKLGELSGRLEEAEKAGEKASSVKSIKAEISKAEKEREALISNPPPDQVPKPKTEVQKVQLTKFDWDYSLGWLLVEGFLDNDKVGKAVKDELKEILPLTTSGANKGHVICRTLSDKPLSFTELGQAIQGSDSFYRSRSNLEYDPELLKRVKMFLGIKDRMHFRKVPKRSTQAKAKKTRK